jgi:hypothetical protein
MTSISELDMLHSMLYRTGYSYNSADAAYHSIVMMQPNKRFDHKKSGR